ncbi:MAG: hypothetical protein IPG85_18285 [Bacteroidetes bacterium]|nr:hypothetical protein [Bacteroidota bacterium]
MQLLFQNGGLAPIITTSPTIPVNSSISGGSVPAYNALTARYAQGCTNSIITFDATVGFLTTQVQMEQVYITIPKLAETIHLEVLIN